MICTGTGVQLYVPYYRSTYRTCTKFSTWVLVSILGDWVPVRVRTQVPVLPYRTLSTRTIKLE
eukprot:SAG31_NODE_8299_length_1478_cov_1.936186_2_plen_63_part_00